jgi:hypothetical protein
MLRIGLALYLTVATVAAPGLCCCSLGRLPSSLPVEASAPSAPHSCCGQCEAPASEPVTDREEESDTPTPAAPNRPCPCKQRSRDASALTATDRPAVESVKSFVSHLAPEPAKCFTASFQVGLDTGDVAGGPIAFPYHGPRGILRALHILRC